MKEGWFDDWSWKDVGHLGLDAVAVVSSVFPGIGSTVSIVADVGNAAWYFSEGKTVTASLYLIMAIPGVGDVFAIPIQAALKLGGKGLMKVPGMKKAIESLIKNSKFIKKYLEKFAGHSMTKPIAKSADEILEKVIALEEKEGTEAAAKFLEESLAKENSKATGGLGEKVSEFAAEKAMKMSKSGMKRVIPKVGGAIFDPSKDGDKDDDVSPTPKDKGGKSGGGGKSCSDKLLKYGCRGENVKDLQQKLLDKKYSLPRKGADGWFGPETRAAVKSFQKDNGLSADGIVGPKTLAKLETSKPSNSTSVVEPKEDTVSPTPKSKPESTSNSEKTLSTKDAAAPKSDEKAAKEDKGFYWMANKYQNASPQDKPRVKQELLKAGWKDKPEIKESKIPSSRPLNSITKRTEQLESLIFERLVKDANRLR